MFIILYFKWKSKKKVLKIIILYVLIKKKTKKKRLHIEIHNRFTILKS